MQNRKRDRDIQNRLLDSVGEGEGGMFRENSIETCILLRVKQITSPGWMHETSAHETRLVHWEDPEGSGWEIHVNPWLIHVNVWQKPLQNSPPTNKNKCKKKKGPCTDPFHPQVAATPCLTLHKPINPTLLVTSSIPGPRPYPTLSPGLWAWRE